MKRLLHLFLLVAFTANAQFYESFNGTNPNNFPPAGWLVADNGVGSLNWQSTIGSPYDSGIDGSPAAIISQQNIGAGNTSLDWLITPQVTVGPGYKLFVMARTTINGYNNSYLQVLVSTSSQDDLESYELIANFADDEVNAISSTVTPNLIALPLTQFEGQQIHIAFRRVSTQATLTQTGDRIIIDDIIVSADPQLPIFTLQGHVRFDASGSCVNGTSWPFAKLQAVSDIETKTFYTNQQGFYSNYIRGNDVSITVLDYNTDAFAIAPASHDFTYGAGDPISTGDFCMSQNNAVADASVSLATTAKMVPGGLNRLNISYSNQGSLAANGTVRLLFNDPQFEFISSSVAPTSETPNSKSWEFSNLQPLEARQFYLIIENNTPGDDPPLNLGDLVTLHTDIAISEPDYNTADNEATLQQIVVSSYDPNDKQVSEGPQISLSQAAEYLHYLIRFQNTGTAEAHNVEIRDVLDSNFDLNTLEVIGASHDMHTSLLGRQVTFSFHDISLPAEQEDEPNSHGYVLYRIKPAPGFAVDDSVSNTAKIYFDFNYPIVTNTVVTQVTELGLDDSGKAPVLLSPNPASGDFTLVSENDITWIGIYSISGQLLREESPTSQRIVTTGTEGLNTGTYIVKINSASGQTVRKLIVR